MIKLNLNENFISRIWENKSYYSNLETIDGKKITVISPGIRNKDEGPDYSKATIRIDGYVHTGDVEIHKTLKDWSLHNHKNKGKYNKVILQVVMWQNDSSEEAIPEYKHSEKIPTVILSKFLTKSIHLIWREIIESPSSKFRIPCFELNQEIEIAKKITYLENMGLKRFHYRSKRISDRIENLKNNKIEENIIWLQTFSEYVFEALGFSKNKNQFLKLSKLIFFEKIYGKNFSLYQIDALLFGAAGFQLSNTANDNYTVKIKSLWENEMKNFSKGVMDNSEWNFFRLRPQNFPTKRIAYASGFLFSLLNNSLFNEILNSFNEQENIYKNLFTIFYNIKINSYWNKNYNFGKPSKISIQPIGEQRIYEIIVNVVLPFIFQYALYQSNEKLCTQILNFFSLLKDYSKNEITKAMEKQLNIQIKKAIESQGAIHLHNFYCIKGKCDFCNIGKNVFVKEKQMEYLNIILY